MENKKLYYRIDFVSYKDYVTPPFSAGKTAVWVKLSDSLGRTMSISNTKGTVEEFNELFTKYKAELIEQGIFAFAKTTFSEGKEGIDSIYCDIYVESK